MSYMDKYTALPNMLLQNSPYDKFSCSTSNDSKLVEKGQEPLREK